VTGGVVGIRSDRFLQRFGSGLVTAGALQDKAEQVEGMNMVRLARQDLVTDNFSRGGSAALVPPSRLRHQVGNRKRRAPVRRGSGVYTQFA
jgi:hypothetical protein